MTKYDALAALMSKLTGGRREPASQHSDRGRRIAAAVLITAVAIAFVILTVLAVRDLIDWFVGLLEGTASLFSG